MKPITLDDKTFAQMARITQHFAASGGLLASIGVETAMHIAREFVVYDGFTHADAAEAEAGRANAMSETDAAIEAAKNGDENPRPS